MILFEKSLYSKVLLEFNTPAKQTNIEIIKKNSLNSDLLLVVTFIYDRK